MRHIRAWLFALTLSIVPLTAAMSAPTDTLAYNGTTAASYADAHWKECDSRFGNIQPPSPYTCVQNNCTNFASRMMAAGGYVQVMNGQDSWYYWNSVVYSDSWIWVTDLYFFLVSYERGAGHPGGTVRAYFVGVTAAQQYNVLSQGDLIFMDYGNNNNLDHMRVEVGWGDPGRSGYQSDWGGAYAKVGDWADQQTVSRYHDFWNGFYQLTSYDATHMHIIEVHVNS